MNLNKTLCRILVLSLCITSGKGLKNFTACGLITNTIQQRAVVDFVKNFTATGKIKNFVIFYNAQLDITGVIDIDKLIWELQMQNAYRSQLVFTDSIDSAEYNLNVVLENFGNLIIVFVQDKKDALIEIITESLAHRRRSYMIIAVAVDINTDIELQMGFEYLWQKKLHYPILIDNRGHFYTMKLYPKVEVINVTTTKVPKEKFPPADVKDLQGYEVMIPIQMDEPYTSWSSADNADNMTLDGIGGIIFKEFMRTLNVSIRAYHLDNDSINLDLLQINELLSNESIEISPFLSVPLYNTTGVIVGYPIFMTKYCLVIPFDNELSRDTYLLRPFQWIVWLVLVLIYILVCCNIILWSYFYALCKKSTFDMWQNIFDTALNMFKMFLFLPLLNRWEIPNDFSVKWYSRLVLTFTLVLLIWGTFTLSQVYSTTLTSLLTVTIYTKPQATISKILKANRTILADNLHMKFILDAYPELRNLIKLTSIDEFSMERNALNPSYDYAISENRWYFLDKIVPPQDKHFWFTDICFGNFPLQYQLRADSHFYKQLLFFSMRIQASGLQKHWSGNFFNFSYSGYGYSDKNRSYSKSDGILNLDLMGVVFQLLLTNLLLCIIIFIAEVFWQKLFRKK